jgi:hypothetical protein
MDFFMKQGLFLQLQSVFLGNANGLTVILKDQAYNGINTYYIFGIVDAARGSFGPVPLSPIGIKYPVADFNFINGIDILL